jgi:hypothetical protein
MKRSLIDLANLLLLSSTTREIASSFVRPITDFTVDRAMPEKASNLVFACTLADFSTILGLHIDASSA